MSEFNLGVRAFARAVAECTPRAGNEFNVGVRTFVRAVAENASGILPPRARFSCFRALSKTGSTLYFPFGFVGQDVCWTVKTHGFVGPDVRSTVTYLVL